MFEDLSQHDRVEDFGVERQRLDVRLEDRSLHDRPQVLDRRHGDVGAGDVESASFKKPGEAPESGSRVQYRASRLSTQEQAEEELFAELVTRPHELRRGAPFM